nr:uncharacterized mitochondrial protein AtMg00810-like [Tanacetum cinerariifolium]
MAKKHLDADLSGTSVNQTKYCSMVGALMYLTASRPDIVHATCYCAHYQAKLTEKHLTVVKRIFRYLKDTINLGIWYAKDIDFELTAFSDLDHAGCLDLRKSTSGGIQFLGGDKLVSWSSKKQDCTLMSPAEANHSHLMQSSTSFPYQAHRYFKNMYPSDFEDLNLLLLQGHLDRLPGSDKQMLSAAVKLWTRNLVIRHTGLQSQGIQDQAINLAINTRFWTQKDVTRSKEFIAAIERQLKTRRIYQNLECFVGGRVRDINYGLLQRMEWYRHSI